MSEVLGPFLQTLRPEVTNLPKYNAGLSLDFVRAKYGLTNVAKLGSNENPYGPSPKAIEAIAKGAGDVFLYPDASCDDVRTRIADKFGVDPEQLIFGNGSEDLISVVVHTFLSPGARVVTFAPSFGLHVIWPESVGAEVITVQANAEYRMEMDAVRDALTPETRILIFGNPSNPLGNSLSEAELRQILEVLDPKTLLVFDEAYLEYAMASGGYADFLRTLQEYDRPWLILRTFSKAYGLAGLRIGYAIASHAELIDLMDRVRAPFNVNRVAQQALLASLDDAAWTEKTVADTVQERERVAEILKSTGIQFAPSLANFLFVKTGGSADVVAEELLKLGVIVKPWREPAWTDHIRVSIGTPAQNDHFLRAWKELVARGVV